MHLAFASRAHAAPAHLAYDNTCSKRWKLAWSLCPHNEHLGAEASHHTISKTAARVHRQTAASRGNHFFSEHQETAGLLTASPRVSTCVTIYRQSWFCIFSARCALAVSAEALPVFSPSFHFSALCGHFLSGALELMSALFSF